MATVMSMQTKRRRGAVAVQAVGVVAGRGVGCVMLWPSVIDTCAKSASVTAE